MSIKNLASSLRHVIIIQNKLAAINDGIDIEVWESFAVVRAAIKPLYDNKIGEIYSAMQLIEEAYSKFTIRFIPNLSINMRIIYNNRIFIIKRIINNNELNISLSIIAQETI